MNHSEKNGGKFQKLMLVVIPVAFTSFCILLGCLAITGLLKPILSTVGLPALSVSAVLGTFLSVFIFKKMYELID